MYDFCVSLLADYVKQIAQQLEDERLKRDMQRAQEEIEERRAEFERQEVERMDLERAEEERLEQEKLAQMEFLKQRMLLSVE